MDYYTKITPKGDLNNNTVVDMAMTKWNLIRGELIEMNRIVARTNQDNGYATTLRG